MKAIIFLIILFLFSCATTSKISHLAQQSHIVKTERIIDTIRILDRDTTTFKALLECDSLGRVRMASLNSRDSEISRLKSSLKNNVLDIEIETKTVERIKELIRIDTVYINKEVMQYEKKIVATAWWKQILMWLGVAFIAMQIPKLIKLIRLW